MNNPSISSICAGAKAYLRTFALADVMELYRQDGLEWIAPYPGFTGPALVYDVSAEGSDIDLQIGRWIEGIDAGQIPASWFTSPDWTPKNVVERLIAKGFRDQSNPAEPEWAMALPLGNVLATPSASPDISIRAVVTTADFQSWCDVVNPVLHGWPMVTVGRYSSWLGRADIRLYLAFWGSVPVATSATVLEGSAASLEFVATLPGYRKRGVATAACLHALRELKGSGAQIATLRASAVGASVYERMGFQACYRTMTLEYPKEK